MLPGEFYGDQVARRTLNDGANASLAVAVESHRIGRTGAPLQGLHISSRDEAENEKANTERCASPPLGS